VLSDLFFDYLDVVAKLQPKVAIAENVKGMLLGNARGYTRLVIKRFEEIGYVPQLFLLNSADCGVPQKRERVFFCAVRKDVFTKKLIVSPRNRWIGPQEACSDLIITSKELDETKHKSGIDMQWWSLTKPGESYCEAIVRAGGKQKLWNTKKLHPLRPANTLTAFDGINHWNEPRRMTFREWKRIGSFPDDYQARSDKIGKYMIGMSVPPKMTYAMADAVVSQWLLPNKVA
jgi:DNA (cytosine-5)-methyltransferase 1